MMVAWLTLLSDGDLLVDERLAHPLVDPFVAAADEDHARPLAVLAHQRLAPDASLRREQDRGRPGALGLELLDRGKERLGLHDHTGAAAVGGVVRDPVPVEGPGAQVVDADVEPPRSQARWMMPSRSGESKNEGKIVRMSMRIRN